MIIAVKMIGDFDTFLIFDNAKVRVLAFDHACGLPLGSDYYLEPLPMHDKLTLSSPGSVYSGQRQMTWEILSNAERHRYHLPGFHAW